MKKYCTTIEEEWILWEMYCEGKSALWRMFFGWRETIGLPNGENRVYYKLPKKAYKRSQELLRAIKRIELENCVKNQKAT